MLRWQCNQVPHDHRRPAIADMTAIAAEIVGVLSISQRDPSQYLPRRWDADFDVGIPCASPLKIRAVWATAAPRNWAADIDQTF